jgi:hypothetical protein
MSSTIVNVLIVHVSPTTFTNHYTRRRNFIRGLFLNAYNTCFSFNASNHKSCLHEISDKIIILYITSLRGLLRNGKIQHTDLNIQHSETLTCYEFVPEGSFEMLLSFLNI